MPLLVAVTMVRPLPLRTFTKSPLALAVFTKTTVCGGEPRRAGARSRPPSCPGPGRLNRASPGLEAAVADEEDEHEIAGAAASATAPSAFWTFSRVARPL